MNGKEAVIQAIQYFVLAFTSLFPMVNPFSTIPLLLSLTSDMSEQERRAQAIKASRNAGIIMVVALFLGGFILEFFGISIGALRIAGGLIVAYLGFGMLFPSPAGSPLAGPGPRAGRKDFSFIPLALPSLAGAGTLALVITLSTQITEQHSLPKKVAGYVIVVLAIACVTILSAVILRASVRINDVLGEQGLEAMSRIVGLLMICVGVQFIAGGVRLFITGP